MQKETDTNILRIIAKLDNDFNIDNTDYVPRVAAWVMDALSILKCTPTEIKERTIPIINRIGYLDCCVDVDTIKVFDKNGCEVKKLTKASKCGYNNSVNPSTGSKKESDDIKISDTLSHNVNSNPVYVGGLSTPAGMDENNAELHNVSEIYTNGSNNDKHFIPLGKGVLELTFDTDEITVQYEGIKTMTSEEFGMELPVVPNNGLLIEAVTYYCMYKILCRGVKHPVFNLAASQYGTNPYHLWTTMQEKVKRSVMFDAQGNILESDKDLWDSSLALFSFD